MPELSVVIPVYRCDGCLEELYTRLCASLATITDDFELVFVEDRGGDRSWQRLGELAARDGRVHAFRLSRNFGQHAAITAGISRSSGDWVVVMDCDLQDPPEDIPRLYAKAREGYDVVLGRRRRRPTPWPRRALSRLYFRLIRAFTGVDLKSEYGSFSIVSRKVADAYLRFTDRNRHYLFILHWLGFDRVDVEYDVAERAEGRSSYSALALIRHAVQGLFFQTTVLLRWVVYFGFVISAAGAIAAIYFVAAKLTGTAYPGWTSLVVLLLIIGGVVIISVGVTGLYVGEVFQEVRARPLFVIDKEAPGPPGPVRDAAAEAHTPGTRSRADTIGGLR